MQYIGIKIVSMLFYFIFLKNLCKMLLFLLYVVTYAIKMLTFLMRFTICIVFIHHSYQREYHFYYIYAIWDALEAVQ